ncbi:T9SS C-terminal target domain-containing protein [Rhodohalobacter sp. SW132]|uniref:endo-1,4-beta-xylanase n=1 Tax=Rhodohalobacter sp. SW132 TaxID=2293433 RepID=UPI000E245DF7|nr:endo-1,4-beta-xylanase [Rhodohalobacter sp. SW132]REL38126.1 T9SS C-terminal target domain-containing protein [Rhodohalobacter sp. SW132]
MEHIYRYKFTKVTLCFVLGLLLVSISGISEKIYAQQDVIVNTNGSFELSEVTTSGDTAAVEGWQFFVLDDGAAGTYAIVDSVTKDGNRALAVTVESTGSEEYSLGAVNEGVPVIGGLTYTVSLWAKSSEAGGTANFTVHDPNNNFMELGRVGSNDVSLTTEWQEFSFNFTAPNGADTLRAPMHFSFEENIGKTIYLDSVSITHPKIIGIPLVFDAESGELGSEWITDTDADDGSTYVEITTDISETSGSGTFPGENRTITYEITFPDTGNYDLFARVYVGSQSFDDDSWFTPRGFGEKSPDNPDDWQAINGLAAAGFNMPDDVVREAGGLGSEVWKWVNFTKNGYQSAPADTFIVDDPENLTYTFQIGASEDGFRIDKIAFGLSDFYYTVENLDNGEAGSPIPPISPVEPQDPIAQGKEKWLGNIYSPAQTENFEYYWNQVTAENAGKWGSVEGTRGNYNWGALDASYNLARDNGFPYRFHILTWGGQQPGWINDLSTEEQLVAIEEWYDAVAERYPDMEYVEVVNEGCCGHQLPDGQSGSANYIEALGGTGETGHDWIITAFEMARERFPNSKLMINDYNIVSSHTWNTQNAANYRQIIDDLIDRDLIDVIGVQAHGFSTVGTRAQMTSVLDLLAETGLPIQATEMDIDGYPSGTEAQSDQVQLENMQRIFPTFWEHPAVEGVTFWGWRPGLWRQDQDAFLVRNNGEERPALEWLRAYVDTANVELNVSTEDITDTQPQKFDLKNNYPNPFNPATTISYTLPAATDVTLHVYDVTGRRIQTLVNSRQTAGSHTIRFDASNLSTGIYFYEIRAGNYRDVKKMTLIK